MKSYKLIKKKSITAITKKTIKHGSNEILTKVIYSGVCGSDLSVYLGHHPYKKAPVVLGHEFIGKVIKTGSKIKNIKKNDIVTSLPYDFCNKCENCKKGLTNHCKYKTTPSYKDWDGTFAEYFLCKKNSTYKLSKNINYLDAVLIEPFAICHHAINLVNKSYFDNTLILGAGNTGLATLMLAKVNKNFHKIGCVDVHKSRKKFIDKLGGDYFVEYNKNNFKKNILKKTNQKDVDLIIITCDYKHVIKDAIEIIKPKGTIIIISYFKEKFMINYNEIVKKEINLKGSFLSTLKDFKAIEKLILKKKIRPKKIISNIYSFKKTQFAFEKMNLNRNKNVKIILKNEK